MKFAEKLKKAMQELNLNQRQVVTLTGKSKGSVSQYLSGKQIPSEDVQSAIATSLGLASDYFTGMDQELQVMPQLEIRDGVIPRLDVTKAAKLMGMNHIDGIQPTYEQAEPHYKGEVPIIEYLNNKMGLGDFELQIPLIDAYNALMSDRVTDKEQFIDAILAIYGTLLSDGDEYDEEGNKISDSADEAQEELKKKKILELPDGTKAEYLTRTFDENGVEILKKAIEQDIHKFSHIPCMSDESFGGNVSGVAMEFKLLGMENITKIKTRYYKKGLRKRLRIFANFYANKGISFDVAGIVPTFTRALPKNLLEISQIVSNLWGKVGKKTLLAQIPFVDDPEEELKTVEKEAEDDLKRQQEMFSMTANTPPDDTDTSDSDSDEPDSSQDDKKDPKKKDGKVNE